MSVFSSNIKVKTREVTQMSHLYLYVYVLSTATTSQCEEGPAKGLSREREREWKKKHLEKIARQIWHGKKDTWKKYFTSK